MNGTLGHWKASVSYKSHLNPELTLTSGKGTCLRSQGRTQCPSYNSFRSKGPYWGLKRERRPRALVELKQNKPPDATELGGTQQWEKMPRGKMNSWKAQCNFSVNLIFYNFSVNLSDTGSHCVALAELCLGLKVCWD